MIEKITLRSACCQNILQVILGWDPCTTRILDVNEIQDPAPQLPGDINQTERTRRWGRGGERDIAICGSLTAHFNFRNRC